MLACVKRTTVKIPDSLDARLRHEAARRGVTISEITREALEMYLVRPSGRRTLGAAAAGRSGRSDISERIGIQELGQRAPHSSMTARERLVADGVLLAAPSHGHSLPQPLPAVGPSNAELLDAERDERL